MAPLNCDPPEEPAFMLDASHWAKQELARKTKLPSFDYPIDRLSTQPEVHTNRF